MLYLWFVLSGFTLTSIINMVIIYKTYQKHCNPIPPYAWIWITANEINTNKFGAFDTTLRALIIILIFWPLLGPVQFYEYWKAYNHNNPKKPKKEPVSLLQRFAAHQHQKQNPELYI